MRLLRRGLAAAILSATPLACTSEPDVPARGTVKASALGPACEVPESCPSGQTCAKFAPSVEGEREDVPAGLRCAATSRECDDVTCPDGTTCWILESYPAQIVCSAE